MPYTTLVTGFGDFTEDVRIATYCGIEIARSDEGKGIAPVMEAIRAHALANGVTLPDDTSYQMITYNVRGVRLALEVRRSWRELGGT